MYVLAVGQVGLLVEVDAGFERGSLICFLGVAQVSSTLPIIIHAIRRARRVLGLGKFSTYCSLSPSLSLPSLSLSLSLPETNGEICSGFSSLSESLNGSTAAAILPAA